MILSYEDSQLFYRLFYSLLNYTNERCQIVPNAAPLVIGTPPDGSRILPLANHIWSHRDIIDDFLADNPNLPADEASIVRNWKHGLQGSFLIERVLKKGAIMVHLETSQFYQVIGLTTEWEEMFPYFPVMMRTTLLPFRDRITYAVTIEMNRVTFGGGIKKSLREQYMEAKRNGAIHTTLDDGDSSLYNPT